MAARTPSEPTWIDQPPDYQGIRATVMGLGRFGGGEAVVRFLAERGVRVTATDLKGEHQLAGALERLADLRNVEFHLGRHVEHDFLSPDLIVVNPAVPLDHPLLQRAVDSGVRLTSEINLFWLHCPADVIGVTGTAGKSTTASLIHALLAAAGLKPRLGGNIGRSLLNELDVITADDRVVLELSSFQLETLDRIGRSPKVAVVTNFAPNHLDRHGSLPDYRHAKQTVLRYQHADDVAILNADDDDSGRWPTLGRRLCFGSSGRPDAFINGKEIKYQWRGCVRRIAPEQRALRAPHNLANLAAAVLASGAAGADLETAEDGIRTFQGLPHRLQVIAEQHGRVFIDDSKATTPESAIAAIEAFQCGSGRLILLAGGADKQVDLRPLSEQIARSVSAVALMGETSRQLAAFLDDTCGPAGPRRFCAPSFTEAFDWAVRESRSGDTVLLSPGCASYGWFDNYEQRGQRFRELVEDWVART